MKKGDLGIKTTISFASVTGLATIWYFAISATLGGSLGPVVPVLGAIAIAGLAQIVLQRRFASHDTRRRTLSMAQHLQAFNSHAIVNIVDDNDRIVDVNDRLLDVTGFSRDDLVGQPIRVMYDSDAQHVAADIRAHLDRGEDWRGVTPLRRKNGGILHAEATIMPLFDTAGQRSGSIAVRTDISRVRASSVEHQTAQTLFELRDDIWILAAESEAFSYMNRSAVKRLNWDASDLESKTLSDLPRNDGIDRIIDACRDLRQRGGTTVHLDTDFLGMAAHVTIKLISQTGAPARILVLASDISDRVERDQRMSDFLSAVSHELRSPMTSIKGAMGLVLSGSAGELSPKARNLVEIAHRNADRLVLIINDILDLQKIANGQMEFEIVDTDLAELVREAERASGMLQQRFGVSVEIVGADVPMPFRTDANRVVQVLTNLLSNAYKFSNLGGKITISVSQRNGFARIGVTDQGQGIPYQDQHKVFEKFADMSNSDRVAKGGTGLGLNICKTIVEHLGGSIGFDSLEGEGTTFYFTLPCAESDAVSAPRQLSAS